MSHSANPSSSSVSAVVEEKGRGAYRNSVDADNYHLFTWTDERVVEEVEDVKCMVNDIKTQLSEVKADVAGLENQLEHSNVMNGLARNRCCAI
ncbi:hypothetical protein HID58_079455, partial [Brassica napus]